MNEYILLDQLIIKMVLILGASLLVERMLTFLGVAINRLFMFQYSNRNTQVEKLREQMAREQKAKEEDEVIRQQEGTDDDPDEVTFNPAVPREKRKNSGFDLLLIRPLHKILNDKERYRKYKENNSIRKEFWMQILGTLVAIVICMALQFSVWEFFVFAATGDYPEAPSLFGFIFTGIIIGSGSKPVNFLMKFIVRRKIEVDQDEVQRESMEIPDSEVHPPEKETATLTAPPELDVQPLTIEERLGFEYDGGDRPGRLENTHLYPNGIDLIVYHHTTMHSDAPFEEVVKEFDRKGWLTGYHCVVFQDGTIRVLCRWDRFGNHALPHNRESFGIAFQGNFETNPEIPFSNPDGKLGIKSPKQAQLKAAARVVAMYALMRDIPFAFPESFANNEPVEGIIPHNVVAQKACPGSNFPNDDFKEMIERYFTEWKDDEGFKTALNAFKQKPMVKINNA